MSSKSRKRARTVAHDDDMADCPFRVTVDRVQNPKRDNPATKMDWGGDEVVKVQDKRALVQPSPFKPGGKFGKAMDQIYVVEPRKQWHCMTRYRSFLLHGQRYRNDEFVYVANERTKECQMTTEKVTNGSTSLQPTDYWVAKILEIRAADKHHVYARVYWMYWPDELPPYTLDGKKTMGGRQPYHGRHELVASNHMDIINIHSVATKVTVREWIESNDDEMQDTLYWRQTFNCLTCRVSPVEPTCKCKNPANPDRRLIGCTNLECGEWLHEECLLHDTLMRFYERLGADNWRQSNTTKWLETDDGPQRRPGAPVESNGDKSAPSPIAARIPSQDGSYTPPRKAKDTSSDTEETPTPESTIAVGRKTSSSSFPKRRRRKTAPDDKPYEGLFEASLILNEGPTLWEITDLDTNIHGGERIWKERAKCLVCDATLE